MLIRAALALPLLVLLTACGEKEEPACCAIEPKAKCDAALHALGVTEQESRVLAGPQDVCPTSTIPLERIRELDSQWPQACREAGIPSPQMSLDRTACRAPGLETLSPPAGADATAWAGCGAKLADRGLSENELWLMMHDPAGICPNVGVSEARIREIIASDWDAAQCTHATKEQMLKALDTGACGGDAG